MGKKTSQQIKSVMDKDSQQLIDEKKANAIKAAGVYTDSSKLAVLAINSANSSLPTLS